MLADAQRDGRPVEYRRRRLLNAAVWLTHTARGPCSNAANIGLQENARLGRKVRSKNPENVYIV